ncbi:hypothetical protein Trydic_g8691 [Trypoxylus dichotomus]
MILNFNNFCENITSTPVAARLHKAMAKDGTGPVMALRKPDGSYTKRGKERVNLFLETHFSGSKQTDLEEATVRTRRPKSEDS